MKNNITECVFILDKSGSMCGLEADTIGEFNSMLKQQKQKTEQGRALVTTIMFSSESSIVHDRMDIDNVPFLTEKDYRVGGCTALLDAIGKAICHIESIHKYARAEDVPDSTLFVITTDGMENASKEFTAERLRKLIEKKKECGWEFLFLGANIDAVGTAKQFGISEDRSVNFICDSKGTALNYAVLNDAVASVRCSKKVDANWKKRIEQDFSSRKK